MTNQERLTELGKIRADLRGTLAAREDATQRRKLDALIEVISKLEIAVSQDRS